MVDSRPLPTPDGIGVRGRVIVYDVRHDFIEVVFEVETEINREELQDLFSEELARREQCWGGVASQTVAAGDYLFSTKA